MHVASRLEKLEADLAAGLPAADDQHSALREVAGVAVRGRVHLDEPARRSPARTVGERLLEGAGRDDDAARREHVVGELEHEPVVARSQRSHVCCPNRRADVVRVALERPHDLVERRERIGVGAGEVEPGQLRAPVRRVQVEGVPARRAPRLGDASSFEDDMLDAESTQVVARRTAPPGRPR